QSETGRITKDQGNRKLETGSRRGVPLFQFSPGGRIFCFRFPASCFPRTGMGEILIGSAGWSYKDWAGKVYPDPAPPGFDPLAYLAQYFPVIEVNSSFYRPPTAAMSETWARRTPESFVFTVKAWERFTHDRERFTEADARLFQEGIAPLLGAGKLGAILLQYPWFFRDGPGTRDRIRRAADALRGWAPLVIELRHTSWLDALDFVREQQLNFCNIDQPQ